MLPMSLLIALSPTPAATEYFGAEVGVRLKPVVTGGRQEIVEELYARDAAGKFRLILVSPTHPSLAGGRNMPFSNLLQGQGEGLFLAPPSFGFTKVAIQSAINGAHVLL